MAAETIDHIARNSSGHGGTVLSVAGQLGVPPEAILDFSASINPLGPAPGVRAAVAAAFALAGHYPETGSPSTCRALAKYHSLPDNTITVANGSTELIHLLPRLFQRNSGRALLIAPAFSEYANALALAGWQIDFLTLSHETGFPLDPARVADQLASGYDLLFFCNPGNPSGRLYSLVEITALADACNTAGCFFVLDEAFIDFTEEYSAKHLLTATDNSLILRSMTKFFGFPGIRVGYSIASPTITTRLRQLLPPWSVGVIPQAVANAALADTAHCRRTVEVIARERQHLANSLNRFRELKVYTGSANYLLLRLTTGLTAADLQTELLRELILIRDCSNFEGLDNHFFRIAVRGEAENRRLLQALAGYLKQHC